MFRSCSSTLKNRNRSEIVGNFLDSSLNALWRQCELVTRGRINCFTSPDLLLEASVAKWGELLNCTAFVPWAEHPRTIRWFNRCLIYCFVTCTCRWRKNSIWHCSCLVKNVCRLLRIFTFAKLFTCGHLKLGLFDKNLVLFARRWQKWWNCNALLFADWF